MAINGNVSEWREALTPVPDRPRLPLPYAFGAAFIRRGHRVSAIDARATGLLGQTTPFDRIYGNGDLGRALKSVDGAILWGGQAIQAVVHQLLLEPPWRRVLLGTYVWKLSSLPPCKLGLGAAVHAAAPFARAVAVMTEEQARLARASLPRRRPVIRFRCGIDTRYYSGSVDAGDVPDEHRPTVDTLLKKPYAIMPGDELRCESDALDFVSSSGMTLVRISQYTSPAADASFRLQLKRRNLGQRLLVFRRIDYRFLRFLLRHASVYLGLVDSRWQCAGWTVASEALASGLPMVLYDGLVARELQRLGAGEDVLRVVAMNDVAHASAEVEAFLKLDIRSRASRAAKQLASRTLDCEDAAPEFVSAVEKVFQ